MRNKGNKFKVPDLISIERKKLCFDCVGERYLKAEIKSKGKKFKCHYCKKISNCYSISTISKRIDSAFSNHYVRSSDEPTGYELALINDKESDYIWYPDGEPVVEAIMNAAKIPELAAQDIQYILEEKYYSRSSAEIGEATEYSSDTYYEERTVNDGRWQKEWASFENALKKEARYFSRSGAEYLESIFGGIQQMRDWKKKPLVINAGPKTDITSFYRARVFQSDDKLKLALGRPDQHLGPPPSELAIAGRMNARGISVFYGANDPRVALSEVRPPVGSQVTIARFEVIRSLRLLDLTALSKAAFDGSIFDIEYIGLLEKAMFLRNLSHRMTAPVMPDHEEFEYLATQVIADFLAESSISLDGIIFPSVQVAGKKVNVVLFYKASQVEDIEFSDGTKVDVSLGEFNDDGWQRSYSVQEKIPVKKKESETKPPFDEDFFTEEKLDDNPNIRIPALRIDINSIEIRLIKSVKFNTENFEVTRFRYKEEDIDDVSSRSQIDWL